jgi:predicted alternative tryptophan synthase beta-subunit
VGLGPGHGLPLRVFDIDLEIYMVKVSYHQKPYRRIIMDLRFWRAGPSQP